MGRAYTFAPVTKVIVKRLNAIQNFGAMDVLCTDKTGTLTQTASSCKIIATSKARLLIACCNLPG
jgi:P-type E1-E2 ATPase